MKITSTPRTQVLGLALATALAGTSAVVAHNVAQKKGASVLAVGASPNRQLTPGAYEHLAAGYLCTHSTAARRNVSDLTKIAVFKRYGVALPTKSQRASWEIDHLIPLALGGTNDITNLWPEKAPGFHKKDALEVRLRTLVCHHQLDLGIAQLAIATDWTAAYRKYVSAGSSESGAPVE